MLITMSINHQVLLVVQLWGVADPRGLTPSVRSRVRQIIFRKTANPIFGRRIILKSYQCSLHSLTLWILSREKYKIWFQQFYFRSDSILRTMRYKDTHDTIFTTPVTNILVVPPSQFSSSVFLEAEASLLCCLTGLTAVVIPGLFDLHDLATSANFAPASVQVSGSGLLTFFEVWISCRVLRRKIRRREGFVPGLFRGGILRRETAGWRTSGMSVRSFLVGLMLSSGTTSGTEGLVVVVGWLALALAAQSDSVEGGQTGTGSSLWVSSEIGFVLAAASGSFSLFLSGSCSSLKVISVDNLLTLSMFSFTDCSTCGTEPCAECICSSMSWASRRAPNSRRDARLSWSIGTWKRESIRFFICFETHIFFLFIIERWYLGKRNTPDGCLLSWCPVEADLCQRARGILSN